MPVTLVVLRSGGQPDEPSAAEQPLGPRVLVLGREQLEDVVGPDARQRQVPRRAQLVIDAELFVPVLRYRGERQVDAIGNHQGKHEVDDRAAQREHVPRVLAQRPLREQATIDQRQLGLRAAGLVRPRAGRQQHDSRRRPAITDIESTRDERQRLDRLRGYDRADPEGVKQQWNLEVVDQDLGVLRRRAANHHARVPQRDLDVHDTGHRVQRAHDIAAGPRKTLELLALEVCGSQCRRRSLASDLDLLVGEVEQHDIGELGAGHVCEPGALAVRGDDERRAERRFDLESAIAVGRDPIGNILDRYRGAADRRAEAVDHAAGDRDGPGCRRGWRSRVGWCRRLRDHRSTRERPCGSERNQRATSPVHVFAKPTPPAWPCKINRLHEQRR